MRRSFWLGVLSWATLAALAVVVPAASHAQERESRLERQMAAAAARQARESERARIARQHWELDRRRSAAHARMPDTMYASTPSASAVELSCPVVSDDDVRRAVQGWGDEVSSSPFFSPDLLVARDGGVLRAPPLQGVLGSSRLSGDDASAESAPRDVWSGAIATGSNADTTSHLVPLFPAASDAALQGFVRVINHSGDSGEVEIESIDDTGVAYGPLTLSIDGDATVHFNSDDLESGNAGKGLTGSTGTGEGDWRLVLTSDLDVEVLSYIRTTDGFLTAMHDLAPVVEGEHRIAIFNPGSNTAQVSRLRLINRGEEEAQVTIEGVDDRGMSPGSALEVTVAAGATQTLTAAELESGGTGMTGALGDGAGKWQLTVKSESSIHALSLLSSPTGHLTNLSTAPSNLLDGVHDVSLFPSASDFSGRQGFVRVINRSESTAEITIGAHDETDWEYEPLTLSLDSGQVAHFNSNDLEQGNAGKGLTGSTGAGEGDWRLALSSDADIEVLSYIRTTDGFLTAMHDVAPTSGTRHRVAIFNPGSNTAQVSRLRLVNAGEEVAAVTIVGTDDQGLSPGADVLVTVPAGGTRTYTAQELEEGAEGLEGSLGDGAGKWRLRVTSDQPIRVLSLLSSPTGHLTNLSTAPQRGAGPVATAEELFRTLISGPIVQSKCVNCHVEGGVSGNTRLVFVTDADADHMATNLKVFEDFLAEVEDGADLILNKIQGALGHGGGIQLAAGTDEFSNMERFLGLLAGEEVASVTITPANLFDGVKLESWRSTLRRAAIIFAGRIPTAEEYEAIRGATVAEFRAAIRNLMQGPEFHEFLIRGSNDRLFTDRHLDDWTIGNDGHFVDFDNEFYRLNEADPYGDEFVRWHAAVQYGAGRAPLELIAHVAKEDLPYTEVLTANYVMANSWSAQAYGANTRFVDLNDVHEFKPSEIVSYYRICDGQESEFTPGIGLRVTDPGPCVTEYPHAGVLNTTVFLLRYPTTATNRNRARSRWTYYHFLGLDIEKSASRTTNPVALADTNNPTMGNPACVVCHTVLDPVAGAFQNYGDEGYYRDQWGGMDSLDGFYKDPIPEVHSIEGESYQERQTFSSVMQLTLGTRVLVSTNYGRHWTEGADRTVALDKLVVRHAESGAEVYRVEFEDWRSHDIEQLEDECGWHGDNGTSTPDDDFWAVGGSWTNCRFHIPVEIPTADTYEVSVVAWSPPQEGESRLAELQIGSTLYRSGDTWYRDMREPGFQGAGAPNPDNSLQWLSGRIVADGRFAEAAVKFWWPSIMGSEVAEAPEDERDIEFEGLLLASNAEAAEVGRLAQGFRRGFQGGSPYSLKDLLLEMVLSRWFRAAWLEHGNSTRAVALRNAGAKRLLGPEELARKTAALTGFQWGRGSDDRALPSEQESNAFTREGQYRLLYGGIDSDGVTDRARDLSSVMSGVAQSHALESSCPIVMKEFYLLPEEKRRLFLGIDTRTSAISEFGASFEIEAGAWDDKETLSLGGSLREGPTIVRLSYTNDFSDEVAGDRNVALDRLDLRGSDGAIVVSQELEGSPSLGDCNHPAGEHYALNCTGSLEVPVHIPAAGDYDIEVVVWADQAGDELPKLEVAVGSDSERSTGSRKIKAKLVEFYERLHGVVVSVDSPEVSSAYALFVDVWNRKRASQYGDFDGWGEGIDCDWASDRYYLDGIVEDAFVYREDWGDEWGARYDWDWDQINAHFETIDWSDRHGVSRTWVVVLAYLLMDYRYLYL